MARDSVKMQKSVLDGEALMDLAVKEPEVRQMLVARFRFLITTDQYNPSAIKVVQAMILDNE